MTLEELPIIMATEDHRSFILSTWVKSHLPHARKYMDKDVYLREEPKVAEANWHHSYVVTSPDDNYVVHAWICGSTGTLLHMYVIPGLRHIGIAKSLIKLVCGQHIEAARPWPFQYPPRGFSWVNNPYLLQQK